MWSAPPIIAVSIGTFAIDNRVGVALTHGGEFNL